MRGKGGGGSLPAEPLFRCIPMPSLHTPPLPAQLVSSAPGSTVLNFLVTPLNSSVTAPAFASTLASVQADAARCAPGGSFPPPWSTPWFLHALTCRAIPFNRLPTLTHACARPVPMPYT